MRFLLLSDIHGNRHGLEAVLQAAAGQYDQILCLGDVIGYGAFPNECCEILREMDAYCLLGNHDAAALGLLSTEWFNAVAALAIKWTASRLKETNRLWLARHRPQNEWEEFQFQAVHGSVRNPLEEVPLPGGGRIEMEEGYKYLINPGSCGQPRDNNPQARCALFDTRARAVEVLAIDYDIEAAREAIIAAGLPLLLGDRLRSGK